MATTNATDDLVELWEAVGRGLTDRSLSFRTETGEASLRPSCTDVRREVLEGSVTFGDAEAIRAYVGSNARGRALLAALENDPPTPLVATKKVAVFVATRASSPT